MSEPTSVGHFDKTRAIKTKHRIRNKKANFGREKQKPNDDGFMADCQMLSIKSVEKCEHAQNNFSYNFHV